MFDFLSSILPIFSSFISPDWTVYNDVQYGQTPDEKADLYLLNEGTHSAVVFIHGGGWSAGDKSAYRGRAKRYALAGFHVIAINYRLATFNDKTTQWPAQLQDVQLAIRWIRQNASNFRIDPNNIGVAGDSAGGHLAIMLGANLHNVPGDRSDIYSTASSWPNCLLNMFGPCDLSAPGLKEFVAELPLFNGQSYEQVPDLYRSASPLYLITSTFPPTIIVHGTSDATVPYSQSVALNQKLTNLGINHEFVTFNGGHEVDKLPWYKELWIELKGLWFMLKILKPNS